MHHERQKGLVLSAIIHLLWLAFVIFGLPTLMNRDIPREPAAITVELLPITGITNIKPSEAEPAKEEKPEDKAKEQKKPTPPVKTAEAPPPPQVEEKPLDVPKEKKEPEKEKDEKKDEKKTKAKEEDLEAVLKAVRDTANKQKTDSKDKEKDSSKTKSKSSQYNENLPMSLSEKDAIRSQIARCWSVPAGAKDAFELIVVLELQLAEDGTVLKVALAKESKDRYNRDSFFRAAADSAMRAVRQCSPLKNLPPDKYGTWRDMELTFDPKEMLF